MLKGSSQTSLRCPWCQISATTMCRQMTPLTSQPEEVSCSCYVSLLSELKSKQKDKMQINHSQCSSQNICDLSTYTTFLASLVFQLDLIINQRLFLIKFLRGVLKTCPCSLFLQVTQRRSLTNIRSSQYIQTQMYIFTKHIHTP